MDESLQELENELKALQPHRPSVLLRAKIERDLASAATPAAVDSRPRYTSATSLRSWKWAGWRMTGALTAVAAISFVIWQTQRSQTLVPDDGATVDEIAHVPSANNERSTTVDRSGTMLADANDAKNLYRPVRAANVLYDLLDEGAVMLENETAARKVRARYVDTYTFKNPTTNASLKLSVPRDEVRILPASFH